MATVKIVPKEDWEIVRKYLGADDGGGLILVLEQNLRDFTEKEAQKIREKDGEYVYYDFGGEADIWIDVLLDPCDYCTDVLLSDAVWGMKSSNVAP